MTTPWSTAIARVTNYLNNTNDTVIAGEASIGSRSRYSGQLGKELYVSQDQIAMLTKTSIGTLYGGGYKYVRRRAADDDSPALGPGKIAFIDTNVTGWETAYQVTTDENLSSTDDAVMRAGIFLNNIEPGNYGWIQIIGEVYVRFRTVLTVAGAPGSRCYCAGAGDLGNDQGTADTLTTDSTSLANARFLGRAVEAPTAFGLKRIILERANHWF